MALDSTISKTLTPDQARAEYFPEMGRAAFYAALRRKGTPQSAAGQEILDPAGGHREVSGKLRRIDGRRQRRRHAAKVLARRVSLSRPGGYDDESSREPVT